jgi:hypothetical protein
MAGEAQAGAVSGTRGVFEVDEDAALAELERARAGPAWAASRHEMTTAHADC